ncbi:hypothetical protein CEXT_672091 [Caerostris extrusa]|uniref:Uncharacterized protein n=1 Tax=Caerostris extrusa TaxID=172846 RepID=A0AAV4RIA6_CAEEX|nr:hypothetical protein CEXT_672091 [Caerostris extrusa]
MKNPDKLGSASIKSSCMLIDLELPSNEAEFFAFSFDACKWMTSDVIRTKTRLYRVKGTKIARLLKSHAKLLMRKPKDNLRVSLQHPFDRHHTHSASSQRIRGTTTREEACKEEPVSGIFENHMRFQGFCEQQKLLKIFWTPVGQMDRTYTADCKQLRLIGTLLKFKTIHPSSFYQF